MDALWDFLFDSWWPFIIGGACILSFFALVFAVIVYLIVVVSRKK